MPAGDPTAPATLSLANAAQSTLALHPQIGIQEQQVNFNRGVQRQAQGIFDTNIAGNLGQTYTTTPLTQLQQFETATSYGIQAFNTDSNTTTLNAQATKLFENGISMGPVVSITRVRDNIANLNGADSSVISYQINLPLLRNRGRDVVAAQEISAGLQVDASLYDLNETIAELLANTASTYWEDVAAEDALKVAAGSEERGRRLVQDVQALIDGDQEPRSDINEVAANLADRTANRIAAQQTVVQAHQQLALAMGLSASQIAKLPNPDEMLPTAEVGTQPANDADSIRRDIQSALLKRPDILAAKKRIDAARVLTVPARNALLPEVDVNVSAGYQGLREGVSFGNFPVVPFAGAHGLDVSGGITYRFPPSNNAALGSLEQANASLRQTELRQDDLARTIASGVAVAVEGVRNATARLASARESVRRFRAALDAEQEKHTLGENSLIDVLTVEDRLTTALENEVQAKAAYALSVVQLRLATGTIVIADKPVQNIAPEVFSQVPEEVVREHGQ